MKVFRDTWRDIPKEKRTTALRFLLREEGIGKIGKELLPRYKKHIDLINSHYNLTDPEDRVTMDSIMHGDHHPISVGDNFIGFLFTIDHIFVTYIDTKKKPTSIRYAEFDWEGLPEVLKALPPTIGKVADNYFYKKVKYMANHRGTVGCFEELRSV